MIYLKSNQQSTKILQAFNPEVIDKYNNEKGLRTLYALHAPSKQYTNEKILKKKMRDHFIDGFNVTNVEFLNTVAWTYFPR